ncbi:MAG: ABC transporter ATP-binding protein, partial [Clostridia bacterium]|nr:ABC transporter ATP-binding protein [Clostridia bacterium]
MENINTEERKKSGRSRMMLAFMRGSRIMLALSVITTALAAFTEMIAPQIIRVAIDSILPDPEGAKELTGISKDLVERAGGASYLRDNIWVMAAALVAVAAFNMAMRYLLRVTNARASESLTKKMRDTLFSHIERLPYSWHGKNKTGDIIQRCTSDVDMIRRFISEQLVSVLRILIMLAMSIAFMLSMNVRLTVIAVIPISVIIAYSILFRKKISATFKVCDENEGKLSAMVQENLTGARVVRAFGKERHERDRFEEHNEYYTSLWVRLAKTMSFFWSSSDILSGAQIMLVVVFGSVFCVRGTLTAGELIAFISYNSMLIWPIRMLGRMISEMSKAGVSIGRVYEIMEAEEERDAPDAIDADMTGDIVFENVSFSYVEGKEILKNIDLTIKSGTTLGILGGTGSGKSTIVLLLDRLYDVEDGDGRITIGGVDIRKIRAEHLRKNIGMVLQEPFLFSRTLGENIGIKSDDITQEKIEEASRAACLHETAESFAKGYDTFVGERGVTLSGGQKQRTAIARNFTTDCPIMIFDDSLSAVDTETDAAIRRKIEEKFGTATVILISHRITTLSKADKIIVLEAGRIVEEGTHEELCSLGGIYS